MLRSQAGAGLALAVLGTTVLAVAPAGAEPLPPGVTLTVTPNPLFPGYDLTVAGTAFPRGECGSAGLRMVPQAEPNKEFRFGGQGFSVEQPWTVTTDELKDSSLNSLPFAVGKYLIKIHCQDSFGNQRLFDTPNILEVTREDRATTTSTAPASTTTTVRASSSSSSSTATPLGISIDGTVEPTTAKPTTTPLTLRGGGFGADKELQISLNTTLLGTTTSNGDGLYAASLKLPASSPPGDHQIKVSGPDPAGQPRTTSANLKVEALSCSDFTTQQAAQAGLAADGSDPHGLDADRDGRACQAGGQTNLSSSTAGAAGVSGAGSGTATQPAGSLARTGTGRGPLAGMAALAAMALGALLIGLSHPAVPVAGSHHRSRQPWRLRRRIGRSAAGQAAAENDPAS